jgi:hypothetical protein
MVIITPVIKDKVLFYLCTEALPEKLSQGKTKEILTELELDFDTFNAIMNQFQRFNLIEDLNIRRTDISFILLLESHDLAQKGGFVAQEEVFKSNIEKLILEVDHLKKQLSPDQLDSANKISAIASAIFSGLTLFK